MTDITLKGVMSSLTRCSTGNESEIGLQRVKIVSGAQPVVGNKLVKKCLPAGNIEIAGSARSRLFFQALAA